MSRLNKVRITIDDNDDTWWAGLLDLESMTQVITLADELSDKSVEREL